MSTISADNIQPSAGGTARNAVRGIAAAWANLNGTGTIALRDSENVSSVVDNGTGDYTKNLSNAMGSINYKLTLTVSSASSTRLGGVTAHVNSSSGARADPTISAFRGAAFSPNTGAAYDAEYYNFDIHGDLA